MEGPVAADRADEEYMTMDADKWSEHGDTYENIDTLGIDIRGRDDSGGCESGPDSGQKKEVRKKEKVATKRPMQNIPKPNTAWPPIHPLPDRYITIRRPPVNANRGPGIKEPPNLVFFRCTIVCLVLLCILLLGGLLGLTFYYDTLSARHKTENVDKLHKEYDNLKEQIDIVRNLSRSIYYVSSTDDYGCFTGHDLFILNYEVLEWQMKETSFSLGRKILENGECRVLLSWNCTRSPLKTISASTAIPAASQNTSTM